MKTFTTTFILMQNRRALLFCLLCCFGTQLFAEAARPNFLLITSDDQSWLHTSKAGYPHIRTPNFDRIANEGVYFERAYVSAPSCAPSRMGILLGQHLWNTESGAILDAKWDSSKFSWQQVLKQQGYETGYTGKAFHGKREHEGWPAGKPWQEFKNPDRKNNTLDQHDLVKNFETFLNANTDKKPFSFWLGSFEGHRPFVAVTENRFAELAISEFMPLPYPDTEVLRADMAGYIEELEIFDQHIGQILEILAKRKLLDNTVIIVSSDNGMDFAKGKTTNYELGVRVPLAVRWGEGIKNPGRRVSDPVSLIDIAATVMEITGSRSSHPLDGQSWLNYFKSPTYSDTSRRAFSAFERHAGFRPRSQPTYPRRAIHDKGFALIRNYFPERWPWGPPPDFGEIRAFELKAYQDKAYPPPWHALVVAKRPYEELYDLRKDAEQFNNLVNDERYGEVLERLRSELDAELLRTSDPVHLTGEDYFAQFAEEELQKIEQANRLQLQEFERRARQGLIFGLFRLVRVIEVAFYGLLL